MATLIRLANDLQSDSIVDGDGLRMVLWFQGCMHNCIGCHNPNTFDMMGGFLVQMEEIKKQIKDKDYHDGITLSGGDPLFQLETAIEIAKYSKSINLNVWVYTGFTFEDLIKDDKYHELLKNIDVLVDGRFMQKLKSLNIKFRGSTNQRLIDVPMSLKENKVIELTYDKQIEEKPVLFV